MLLANFAVADTTPAARNRTQSKPAARNTNPGITMSFDRNYKDGSILVIGGADFIGSRLSERLLAVSAEVVCADNYFAGSRKNVNPLPTNSMLEAIRHDVTFPRYIEVNANFHLACPASPIHYRRDPVQTGV
jgi:UDP-glucuronate decarboxylase